MTLLSAYTRPIYLPLIITLLLILIAETAFSLTKEVEVKVSLPVGEWKVVRLKSLPTGAGIQVEASSKAMFSLLLLDQEGYSLFPDVKNSPLFRGQVVDKLTFSVKIPRTDNYYLVLDNRTGKKKDDVFLKIEASAGPRITSKDSTQSGASNFDFAKNLQVLVTKLQQIFVFEKIQIQIRNCNTTIPLENSGDVTLCVDKIQKLYAKTNDRKMTTDLLIFAFFHQVGHLLMEQWEYPFVDNCEISDEFATVVLEILQQGKRLETVIDYLSSAPKASESIAALFTDNHFNSTTKRSQTILNFKNSDKKMKRWVVFLIPHMQTSILNNFLKQQSPNFNPELIRKEIQRRGMKI